MGRGRRAAVAALVATAEAARPGSLVGLIGSPAWRPGPSGLARIARARLGAAAAIAGRGGGTWALTPHISPSLG